MDNPSTRNTVVSSGGMFTAPAAAPLEVAAGPVDVELLPEPVAVGFAPTPAFAKNSITLLVVELKFVWPMAIWLLSKS
ncbi:hypothetical protein M7I_2719 [Glarea lozoyensis 74030]|uniref:Uncharacterized protein n=1 Tax=Glarea lozoyensis (strain ATCC 74030 / MF5533) TaxID=1104152 RepID=H0EJJ2_GLAL7|nr:hypothetical protein M7I_2719 [Glarea lozoyensis 74030]